MHVTFCCCPGKTYEHGLKLASNKYAFVDLLCIKENANHSIHFPDVRIHICMWCLVSATLLSYVVLQYWICTGQDNKTLNKTLANLLTIHGSNSYQDIRQNHWNLKRK